MVHRLETVALVYNAVVLLDLLHAPGHLPSALAFGSSVPQKRLPFDSHGSVRGCGLRMSSASNASNASDAVDEELMAVPELEDKKALKKTDLERRFHEEPFPVFAASDPPIDPSSLQGGAVDMDKIRDPVFLARVYYSTNQHVGYDISKITEGDSPGAGKPMAPIFQPLTDGLQRVSHNRSHGCSKEYSLDTTHRYTAALKMTSVNATANLVSVFASFAAKMGEDIESQKVQHDSTFTMITKFLAPMLEVGPVLPHKEIYIDEGDDAIAAAVGLDPYFRKDCLKSMEGSKPQPSSMNWSDSLMSGCSTTMATCTRRSTS